MDTLVTALLLAILVVLMILAGFIWRGRLHGQTATIDPLVLQQAVQQALITSTPMVRDAVTSTIAQGSDLFKGAFTASLHDLRFQEEMGAVKAAAAEIQTTSAVLKALFEQKAARASFAEFQLEELLRDAFPRDKFGVRENLGDLGTPDAHIKTPEGIVCIDAKFPLENYRRIVQSTSDGERKKNAREFKNDVKRHIDKVAKYIRPDRNTAPVAYAFIPSEAIFHYLADNEPEVLREAATHCVVVTSPSTLLASLSMIRIAMRAKEITEQAARIEADLRGLKQHFESFHESWVTLRGHIQKAYGKSADVDASYTRLRDKFENVARLRFGEPSVAESKDDSQSDKD